MIKYILVSRKFEGYLVYGFNKAGYLVHFENCTWQMSEEQLTYCLRELRNALSLQSFVAWAANCGHKLIKLDIDLSFERFWREFDMARDRFKAEALWKKMNDEQRHYVFYVLSAYKRYCKRNASWYTHMQANTFLGQHWRDEWDKAVDNKK